MIGDIESDQAGQDGQTNRVVEGADWVLRRHHDHVDARLKVVAKSA